MKNLFEKNILLSLFLASFPFTPFLFFGFTIPKQNLLVISFFVLFLFIDLRIKKINYISLFLIIFVIYSLSSILWVKSIYNYLDELFVYLFPLISIILINSHIERKDYKKIVYFLLFIGVFYSIYSIFQYMGIDFYFFKENVGRYRMIGFMGNPIYYSEFLLPLFILSASIAFYSKLFVERFFSLFIASLLGFAIIATLSRGTWVGMVAGLLILISFRIRDRAKDIKGNLFLFFAIFIGFLLIIPHAISRFLSIFNIHEPSIWRRFMIWLISLDMIKAHPIFGVGIGNYKYYFLAHQAKFFSSWGSGLGYPAGKALKAHNDIIQIFSELGVIGLLLFVSIVLFFLLDGFYIITKDKNLIKYKIGFYIGVISMLVDGLTGFPLRLPHTAFLFWTFFGLLFLNFPLHRKIRLPQSTLKLFKLFFILVFGFYIIFLMFNFFSLVYERKGEIEFLKKKEILHSEDSFKKASSLMPIRGQPHFYLGTIDFLKGNIKEGIREMEEAQKNFDHTEIHTSLGYYYLLEKKYKKAIDEYKKAIMYKKQKDPKYKVKYLTDIGLCYRHLGDFKKAEYYYREALSIDPEFVNAIYNLGVLYDAMGKKDLALSEFKRLWDVVKKDGITEDELLILKRVQKLGYLKLKIE